MELPKSEIIARVDDTEIEREAYRLMATEWEKMFMLDAGFRKTWRDAVNNEGREQVTTPTPRNIALLAQRLIASRPKIDVPARSEAKASAETAQKIERWLGGMWWTIQKQQRRNVIQDAAAQSIIRGRHVLDARWVRDQYPAYTRKSAFPIMIRTLDPLNCGFRQGPLYPEWAYHRYYCRKFDAMQQWPEAKIFQNEKKNKRRKNQRAAVQDDIEVCITDFWYPSPKDGTIWNAVLMDDDAFLVEPFETDYPFMPMVEGLGDTSPLPSPYDALSLLDGINGLWQYECRLYSQIGTGILWYTWPPIFIETPMAGEMPDWEARPGGTYHVPEGTKINIPGLGMNLQPIQLMLDRIDAKMQQSAFPEVLYGDAGSMQAGYGVNLLSSAAKGRVGNIIQNLEGTIQQVHELVLAMVEKWGGDDGVELYAFDESSQKVFSECLYAKEIQGFYRNVVVLRPEVPQDDVQRITTGLQLVQQGVISRETFRDRWVGGEMVAPDEEARVWAEMAEQTNEIKPQMILMYLRQRHPKEWEQAITGTPLEELAKKLGWIEEEALPSFPPTIPPTFPPNLGGTQGGWGPPGMPGGGPPPPGAPPPQSGGDTGGLPPMQPPAPPMPQGGGIPPELAGQFTEEMAGLNPQMLPPGMSPILFAEMMGQPLPQAETLDALAQGGGPVEPGV